MIELVKTLLLKRCALRKFQVTDGENTRDQITSGRGSKRASSNCVLCIPFIVSGSPNECWLHTGDACVITTWRLGLRAPLLLLPQLTQLTQLILRDTRLENVQDLESFMRGPALWGQFCSRRLLSLDRK